MHSAIKVVSTMSGATAVLILACAMLFNPMVAQGQSDFNFDCTSASNCADSCCATNGAKCSGTGTGCAAGCANCDCNKGNGVQQCNN